MKRILILSLLCATFINLLNAQVIQSNDNERTSNPNQMIADALKHTGSISLGIGVPSLIAGVGCLVAANTITKVR